MNKINIHTKSSCYEGVLKNYKFLMCHYNSIISRNLDVIIYSNNKTANHNNMNKGGSWNLIIQDNYSIYIQPNKYNEHYSMHGSGYNLLGEYNSFDLHLNTEDLYDCFTNEHISKSDMWDDNIVGICTFKTFFDFILNQMKLQISINNKKEKNNKILKQLIKLLNIEFMIKKSYMYNLFLIEYGYNIIASVILGPCYIYPDSCHSGILLKYNNNNHKMILL